MTTGPRREPCCRKTPARTLRERAGSLVERLKFAWVCGGSLKDSLRLFYYIGIKPSLVFRGWSSYSPERVLDFSIKTGSAGFRVYARDNGVEAGTIAEFFSPECRLVPEELPVLRPEVIYDVGANIGIASLRFAALYPDARFYGFEPVPSNHEVCVLNYRNLRRAQVFPWAVGSRTEVTCFEYNDDPRGGHLGAVAGMPGLQPRGRMDVQVYSIADLVREQRLEPPSFLKIDVEGAELEVLQGIGDIVQSIKRIFVETHGEDLKAQCSKWLGERGFRIQPSSDPTALWADRA